MKRSSWTNEISVAGRGPADFDALLNALPQAATVFDRRLVILRQNTAHEQMTGRRRGETVGRYMFDAFPPEPGAASAEQAIRASTEHVFATGEAHTLPVQEHALRTPSGAWRTRYWRLTHSPIVEGGERVAILQLSEDATTEVHGRKLVETERSASQEAAGISYFSFDPETDEFARARSVDDMFGFAENEAGPRATPFFERIADDDLRSVRAELERIDQAPDGTPARFDYRIVLPGAAEIRHMRARGAMVIDPSDGRRKLVGVFTDMTDIETTRAALEQTVADKENLLIEVNHRVNNSLQLVSSVLRLEARRSGNPDIERVIAIANSRIDAIAEVHAGLYVGGDVTQVATAPLLRNLVGAVTRFAGGVDAEADILCETADFSLPTDLGVAFGLLANELLTNALKHGVHTRRDPIILKTALHGRNAELSVSNKIETASGETAGTGVGGVLIEGFAKQLKAALSSTTEANRFIVQVRFDLPLQAAEA